MQTVQFKVNDEYMQIILALLKGLKSGIIKDLSVINNKKEPLDTVETDIFSKTSGILSSQNVDPVKWQNEIRSEWDR
jgi:hypothetical protein